MNLSEVKRKTTEELCDVAAGLNVSDAASLRRPDLILAVLQAQSARQGEITADGVLEVLPDGFGFLRAADANYLPGTDDIYVSPSQIRRFNLRTGDTVSGLVRPPKESERYFALLRVKSINGNDPNDHRNKSLFDDLTPIHPHEKFSLERSADCFSSRVIDLLCPIGRGQRCLIVAPPRSGKSALLKDFAQALEVNHPEAAVIMLLIDERPEEVTDMQRSIKGEVLSSTFDEAANRHVQVAEIVIEKARRMAESGTDVVVLLDSLTRLVRAYNAVVTPSGKTLAGGIDPAALHKPKRFFGAARNLENSGSLTIIATALSNTTSAVDQLVIEEFQGAANCQIHLDPGLAHLGVFPCIDVAESGTRREDLLLSDEVRQGLTGLRQQLQAKSPAEKIELLRAKLQKSEGNAALLRSL